MSAIQRAQFSDASLDMLIDGSFGDVEDFSDLPG